MSEAFSLFRESGCVVKISNISLWRWLNQDADKSQLHFPQAQGIADDRNGTQAHRGACNDRAEQQAEERVKHPRRHRNSKCIVEKGEEKVLPDIPHGSAT
jgi:hypothetical protein